jgi:hypothetical protein
MSIDEKLSEVFDVEPISESKMEIVTKEGEVNLPKNEMLDYDYEQTRENLYALLKDGKTALDAALSVARQSEHPRAFEVVSGLMKDLADINGKLLDLHKKKQTIETPKNQPGQVPQQSNTANNAIFVGSTADLSKMLDDLRKGK